MSNYTDVAQEIKWIQQTDVPSISRRNMGIFAMVMNALNVPDKLQEFVFAIYVAGNWERTEYDEISLMRAARSITQEEFAQLRAYNRLKQKSPLFFLWQESKSYVIIDRIVQHEHTTHHKTKARYSFVIHKLIDRLFALPLEMPAAAVRRAVDRALQSYPTIQPTPRKKRIKRAESIAKAVLRNIEELIKITGSLEAADIYLREASHQSTLEIVNLEVIQMDKPSVL